MKAFIDRNSKSPDSTQGSSASPSHPETHFVGLFDGHAGGRCSKHISAALPDVVANDINFNSDLCQTLKRSFHAVNDQFLAIAEQLRCHDGSTGLVALIRDGKVLVANVGDCRAILLSDGKIFPMSNDQKPTSLKEQRRIASLGGTVMNCAGVSRVNGVLAVSRAFGNRTIRHVIRPDPELVERQLTPDDEFLVMASDGLWDVLKNKDVLDICTSRSSHTCQQLAEELVQTALCRGSMDNVTCIVLNMKNYSSKFHPLEAKGYGRRGEGSGLQDNGSRYPGLEKKSDYPASFNGDLFGKSRAETETRRVGGGMGSRPATTSNLHPRVHAHGRAAESDAISSIDSLTSYRHPSIGVGRDSSQRSSRNSTGRQSPTDVGESLTSSVAGQPHNSWTPPIRQFQKLGIAAGSGAAAGQAPEMLASEKGKRRGSGGGLYAPPATRTTGGANSSLILRQGSNSELFSGMSRDSLSTTTPALGGGFGGGMGGRRPLSSARARSASSAAAAAHRHSSRGGALRSSENFNLNSFVGDGGIAAAYPSSATGGQTGTPLFTPVNERRKQAGASSVKSKEQYVDLDDVNW